MQQKCHHTYTQHTTHIHSWATTHLATRAPARPLLPQQDTCCWRPPPKTRPHAPRLASPGQGALQSSGGPALQPLKQGAPSPRAITTPGTSPHQAAAGERADHTCVQYQHQGTAKAHTTTTTTTRTGRWRPVHATNTATYVTDGSRVCCCTCPPKRKKKEIGGVGEGRPAAAPCRKVGRVFGGSANRCCCGPAGRQGRGIALHRSWAK